MSQPQPPREPSARRRGAEMLMFLAASAVGIVALGNGLNGVMEPGKGIDVGWLAVAGVAVLILVLQMGRVQDAWPHRPDAGADPTRSTGPDDAATNSLWTSAGEQGDKAQ